MKEYHILIKEKKAKDLPKTYVQRKIMHEGVRYHCFEEQRFIINEVPKWVSIMKWDCLNAYLVGELEKVGYNMFTDYVVVLYCLIDKTK